MSEKTCDSYQVSDTLSMDLRYDNSMLETCFLHESVDQNGNPELELCAHELLLPGNNKSFETLYDREEIVAFKINMPKYVDIEMYYNNTPLPQKSRTGVKIDPKDWYYHTYFVLLKTIGSIEKEDLDLVEEVLAKKKMVLRNGKEIIRQDHFRPIQYNTFARKMRAIKREICKQSILYLQQSDLLWPDVARNFLYILEKWPPKVIINRCK